MYYLGEHITTMALLCSTKNFSDDSAKGFTLNDTGYVVVKKDGLFYVYINRCPHIGINLEYQPNQFLDIENHYIQCSNHGALFEIETGTCVSGPCTGQSLTNVPFDLIDSAIHLQGD